MGSVAIPYVALIVAVLTFVATQWNARRMADETYVEDLAKRVKRLEDDLMNCQSDNGRLRSENIELLRKLVLANGGGRG